MAIDDQKHRSALTVHQALEELNEHLRTHAAFDAHDPQRSAGTDRRDHIQTEALARDTHDRRLAASRPSAAAVEVRAHPGLIFEVNLRLFPLRQRADPRVLALYPLLDP